MCVGLLYDLQCVTSELGLTLLLLCMPYASKFYCFFTVAPLCIL